MNGKVSVFEMHKTTKRKKAPQRPNFERFTSRCCSYIAIITVSLEVNF